MKKTVIAAVLAVLISLVPLFGPPGQAFAQTDDSSTMPPSRMIVVFRPGVQALEAGDDFIAFTGATKLKDLPLINGFLVMADAKSESLLANNPGVLRVEPDVVVRPLDDPTPPDATISAQTTPWGINKTGAPKAWGRSRGAGVKVGVIDTGIDMTHPDLASNIKGGINIINPAASPNDDNGHGTHVAGIIAAVDNSTGVVGVAPQASLYAIKVMDANGVGYISDIAQGLNWAVSNGIQVVNMSLGTGSDPPALHDAIKAASRAGIVLVAAAGNSGAGNTPTDDTVNYPAKYPEVIAVSATDSSDVLASFSSRGPDVEVAAPGVGIPSTYMNGGYANLSGTSMASPHVAGAAALIIGSGMTDLNRNGVIADEVRDKLDSMVIDLGTSGRDALYGFGRMNLEQISTRGPGVATGAATDITRNSATLNGNLSDKGTASSVQVSFVWGTTPDASGNESSPITMSGPGDFSTKLTDLPVGTYYFKAKAVGDGTAYGKAGNFTVLTQEPNVATKPAVLTSRNSARLNGDLLGLGSAPSADVSFLWGTKPDNLDAETTATRLSAPGSFSIDLGDLNLGARYYFRAKAVGDGTMYGAVDDFVFLALPPVAATRPATDIRKTSATLNGLLARMGTAPSVSVSFLWGTTRATADGETPAVEMTARGNYSASLDGLTPGTFYFFRAKAVGDGVRYGPVYSFRFVARRPAASTRAVTKVDSTSATLNGFLYNLGTASPVQVSFQWGTTRAVADGETAPETVDAAGALNAELEGLKPGTIYYVRLKAVGDGVTNGATYAFRTASVSRTKS